MKPIVSYGCSTFCCMNLPLSEALTFVRTKTDRIEIVSEGFHDLFRYHEACHAVDARDLVHAPLFGHQSREHQRPHPVRQDLV